MELIKKLIFLLITFSVPILSFNTYAEEIHFQGNIVEFTCESDSNNSNCKSIERTVEAIKSEKNIESLNFDRLIEGKSNSTVHLKIENLESNLHKILVVDYY
jgi:type 1 fimbria pilin